MAPARNATGWGCRIISTTRWWCRTKALTLSKGAVGALGQESSSPYYLQTLEALARHYKFSMNEPWEDLPKKARDVILHGSGD